VVARPQVVKRLLDLPHQAKAHGSDLVAFPELALTTFFPRWWMEDELCVARCDLDLCRSYKETAFNFARHRRPEHYRMIVDRTGALPPP
jgi:predicted amidohydrolase